MEKIYIIYKVINNTPICETELPGILAVLLLFFISGCCLVLQGVCQIIIVKEVFVFAISVN